MELAGFVDTLHRELTTAAAASGAEAEALAERLTGVLDAATRLVVQEAVVAAAEEISRALAPGSVDVRLRGRELGFVVTPAPFDQPVPFDQPTPWSQPAAADPDAGESATARLTVRLGEQLKSQVEGAAAVEGLSVNAYLVRTLAAATGGGRPFGWSPGTDGQQFSGWVQ